MDKLNQKEFDCDHCNVLTDYLRATLGELTKKREILAMLQGQQLRTDINLQICRSKQLKEKKRTYTHLEKLKTRLEEMQEVILELIKEDARKQEVIKELEFVYNSQKDTRPSKRIKQRQSKRLQQKAVDACMSKAA
ncbi:hypothetical protein P154DRAFT_563503 [Amniculicola lignicola CBS 123094]|uniref:Uncharacterized protein n=1 Tax=Amniculicola lignicola CBS 123094 TaxID=1392246 RepID=A0A6A5WEB8_9PLEO|nr:hypothetical protein P154DRAFT_563503 [Amniculicola lignicola CBS 123094]